MAESRGAGARPRRAAAGAAGAAGGRGAKKASTNKASTKKAAPKKTAPKKTAPKKTAPKKTAPKKTAPKKTAPKKTAPKKTAPKKTAPKKTAPKKTAPKKTAPKKVVAAPKKAATKKAATKKAATKKAATKKAAPKKTAPKKVVAAPTGLSSQETVLPTLAPAGLVAGARPVPGAAQPAATAGGPAPGTYVVRSGEKPWTAAELSSVRADLEEEAVRLRKELEVAESDIAELIRDSADTAGDDQADAGSKAFEREHEMSLANNTRDLLAQGERAMQRIDDGTYGSCESCGNPIGKERLRFFPRATLCVACKQREERR